MGKGKQYKKPGDMTLELLREREQRIRENKERLDAAITLCCGPGSVRGEPSAVSGHGMEVCRNRDGDDYIPSDYDHDDEYSLHSSSSSSSDECRGMPSARSGTQATPEDGAEGLDDIHSRVVPYTGSAASSSNASTRTRGLSHGVQLSADAERLLVPIPSQFCAPVGPYATRFASEAGCRIRSDLTDWTTERWDQVAAPARAVIEEGLKKKFLLDGSEKDVSKALKTKLGALRRYNRHKLFQGFEKMVMEKGLEYAKSHPLKDMLQEDWDELVNYWSTEKFKNKSKKNSENRRKSSTNHSCGSKSFPRRVYEKLQSNDGVLGSFPEFYKTTHYNQKKGSWATPMCETLHSRMVEDEAIQTSTPDIPALTPEQMSIKHLLPRSGYVKGLGMIPTSSIRSTASSSTAPEITYLRSELEQSKERINDQQKRINDQQIEMNAIKEFMKSLGYNPPPPPHAGSG